MWNNRARNYIFYRGNFNETGDIYFYKDFHTRRLIWNLQNKNFILELILRGAEIVQVFRTIYNIILL